MPGDVNQVVKDIAAAARSTRESVDMLHASLDAPVAPLISDLLAKDGKSAADIEGVSLLLLKNQALLLYLNNVALVVLGHLHRLQDASAQDLVGEAVKRLVVQRVTLERGVKPLERKLAYQLDVMLRSYNRMLAQEKASRENSQARPGLELGLALEEEDDEEKQDEEEEDDNLAYRPDAAALAKLTVKSGEGAKSDEKYRPPKILAAAPPTKLGKREQEPVERNRKLQSMEEYLHEQSDMPAQSSSIGATIVGHGRGGVKTDHDKKREMEIQRYEESNFTRLPTTQTKKTFKQKQRDAANQFGGEDWGMFNEGNQRNIESDTLRKRRPQLAWDRAKRRKQ